MRSLKFGFLLTFLLILPMAGSAEPHLPLRFTNKLGMTFVLIQPGTYLSGRSWVDGSIPSQSSTADKKELKTFAYASQTWRRISQPFYLQTTEVTQGQWRRLMSDWQVPELQESQEPAQAQEHLRTIQDFIRRYINSPFELAENTQHWNLGEGDNYPVYYAVWRDAAAFTERLSQHEGLTYRLPTAGEWEYAARAGTSGLHWWGNNLQNLRTFANCGHVAADKTSKAAFLLTPVGSFKSNPWGLYDMLGNVSELLAEPSDEGLYGGLEAMYRSRAFTQAKPVDEPVLNHWNAQPSWIEVRGGDFSSAPSNCTVVESQQTGIEPGQPYKGAVGFRVLLEAKSVAKHLELRTEHP